MINIVVGAGYGDEGKGHTVAKLIEDGANPNMVIRFNGGHQAGHTVIHDGVRHIFSNFGAGTMHGIPTYWSDYCTIHLRGMRNEYELLKEKGFNPILYVDPLCPVTSEFDILKNRNNTLHGTVGIGFGATIERHQTLKFHALDLMNDFMWRNKFELIREHYGDSVSLVTVGEFSDDIEWFRNNPDIRIWNDDFCFENPIFEGAQGVLLDQNFGFFPHVTRSNATAINAMNLISKFSLSDEICVNYVTRAYQTRHGNGPFQNSDGLNLREDIIETNQPHKYQGEFKKCILDVDLLKISLTFAQTSILYTHQHESKVKLTCANHHKDESFAVRYEGAIRYVTEKELDDLLNELITE